MSTATLALVGEYIMTKEDKKVEVKDSTPESSAKIKDATPEAVAEAEANQKAAEDKAKVEGEKGEGDKKPDAAPKVDYKSELDRVSKELEQARFLLQKKNQDDKKKREEEEEAAKKSTDKDYEDDSKPNSDDVDKKLEEFKLSQMQDVISTELESLSDNSDERELIEFYFKNGIKRSGDTREAIKADLATARFLANRKRFEKLDSEMNAKEKSNPSAGTGSGGHDIQGDAPKNTPNVSDADAQLLKRYGLKPEDIKS